MSLYKDASLAMIPSAYKDGKLYSIRPTDGSGDFTFSRGSNLAATRVDVNGLIEKGRENLLLQSNQFDTTWGNASTTETGGQTDKSGGTDAWKIDLTAAGGWIFQSISTSGVQAFSVYAKAGTLDWVRLYASGSSTSFAYFDLVNGLVGITSGTIDTNIELISNGYYRIDISFNHSSTTAVRIYPAQADNDLTATSGNIYIQDAQLEQGLVATDYIETGTSAAQSGILEDMPRLDYSGGASCPSLLLEPQRTNVITQSEYIGAWTPSGLTITDNDATSPEGVSNAAKLTLPSGSAQKRIALGSMPFTSVARSYSFFVKSDDITAVQLVHSGDLQGYARFDISTGVVGSTGTKTTSDIEDYGNGWYRCVANFDSTNAFGSTIYLYISDSATGGYGGSTSAAGDLFVYGAQLEEGSYPTSYIPTYGSSVTRSFDNASNINVSSLGVTTGYTLFYELGEFTLDPTTWVVQRNAVGVALYQSYGSTMIIETINGFVYPYYHGISGTRIKVALSFDGTNINVFTDGVKRGSWVASSDWNTFGNFKLDNNPTRVNWKQLLIFPTALTDSECIALTTL